MTAREPERVRWPRHRQWTVQVPARASLLMLLHTIDGLKFVDLLVATFAAALVCLWGKSFWPIRIERKEEQSSWCIQPGDLLFTVNRFVSSISQSLPSEVECQAVSLFHPYHKLEKQSLVRHSPAYEHRSAKVEACGVRTHAPKDTRFSDS